MAVPIFCALSCAHRAIAPAGRRAISLQKSTIRFKKCKGKKEISEVPAFGDQETCEGPESRRGCCHGLGRGSNSRQPGHEPYGHVPIVGPPSAGDNMAGGSLPQNNLRCAPNVDFALLRKRRESAAQLWRCRIFAACLLSYHGLHSKRRLAPRFQRVCLYRDVAERGRQAAFGPLRYCQKRTEGARG